MQSALNIAPVAAPVGEEEPGDADEPYDNAGDGTGDAPDGAIEGTLQGFGLEMKLGKDGNLTVQRSPRDESAPPPRRDDRRPDDEPFVDQR